MLNFTLYQITERYRTPGFDEASQRRMTSSPFTEMISGLWAPVTASEENHDVNIDRVSA